MSHIYDDKVAKQNIRLMASGGWLWRKQWGWTMKPKNKPLSPGWLRWLRNANSKSDPEKIWARREAALQLAKRFGLKISERSGWASDNGHKR